METRGKILYRTGCMICGKPIRYDAEAKVRTCAICGKRFETNSACEDGHFVCDHCHSSGCSEFVLFLKNSKEKNPVRLFLDAARLPSVNMHGPEHHSLVPCVLLTAYVNNGGGIDLTKALNEALKRGSYVPGGCCGFWGVCGAAVGAGIYASILMGSSPLNKEAWPDPQRLTAQCLEKMTAIGGPRCCKRTGRLSIEAAAEFTREKFGIEMPTEAGACTFYGLNKECLREKCPYYDPASLVKKGQIDYNKEEIEG